MNFTVRTLGRTDAPLLEAMLTMFGDAFEEPETYNGARPDPAYLASRIAGDSFIAVRRWTGTR